MKWKAIRAVLLSGLLAAVAWGSDNVARAEEACREWQGAYPGVCGENLALQAYGGVGHGSNTSYHCYGQVNEFFYWGRGYNNSGGWHVEYYWRDPETPPNTRQCAAGATGGTVVWAGFRLSDGRYKCSLPGILCYVTTKWSFQNPGSRLFYTSNDGEHSLVQCWNSDPPDDCAW